MRAGSFLLLVALLALGNQLPAALGKRKMGKCGKGPLFFGLGDFYLWGKSEGLEKGR